jgi:hypothetical protein
VKDIYTEEEHNESEDGCENSCCICPETEIKDHFIRMFRRMAKFEEKVCQERKVISKIIKYVKVTPEGDIVPDPTPPPVPERKPNKPTVTPPPDVVIPPNPLKPLPPVEVEGCELGEDVLEEILEIADDPDLSEEEKANKIAAKISCSCAVQDNNCCCMCCCDSCGCDE